jgi:hypothetical protein
VRLDLYKGGVVGRALLTVDEHAGVVHQRRFAGGGHHWDSAPFSVSPSSVSPSSPSSPASPASPAAVHPRS